MITPVSPRPSLQINVGRSPPENNALTYSNFRSIAHSLINLIFKKRLNRRLTVQNLLDVISQRDKPTFRFDLYLLAFMNLAAFSLLNALRDRLFAVLLARERRGEL